MPTRWAGEGLPAKQALPLFAASLLTVALVLFVFGTATAFLDAPPVGPECWFEVDEGSGPAGTGHEEIHWGLLPTKYCVGEWGETARERSVVKDDILPFDIFTLLIYPVALFAGIRLWISLRYRLMHPSVTRRSTRDRLPRLYGLGIGGLWIASYVGGLNWGAGNSPLRLSTTPARDIVGGALWSSWIAAAMALGGFLIARRSRAGPYVAAAAWATGVVFAFRSWAHTCDPATGEGCVGRGFVSIGVLAALTAGMVVGLRLSRARRAYVMR